jgi:hypothetical protein
VCPIATRASRDECKNDSSDGDGVPQGLCGKIRQLRAWDDGRMISVSTGSTIASQPRHDEIWQEKAHIAL